MVYELTNESYIYRGLIVVQCILVRIVIRVAIDLGLY